MNTSEKKLQLENTIFRIGFYISLFGTTLVLLWIGIFKFTPSEAAAIKPLIENHPFTFWIYNVLSIQTVSNIVGVIEIIIAILLILSLKYAQVRKFATFGISAIFLMTLSYLFTTPGVWNVKDGVLITDFFIIKDLAFLGFGLMLPKLCQKI